ncbi:MAG: protein translocase subunit SecD [candidate division Zixibacteria bacterium]|nr:protein translocase subunit SecD [candidate division Zixibacteria bacterium]
MKRSQLWLTLITVFLIIASVWYLYPSLSLWSLSDTEKALLKEKDPSKLLSLEQRGIKLGLDLKGGMHVVLQVDKTKLKPEESKDAVERALEIIRNRIDQFGVAEPLIQKQGEDRIIVELPGLQDVERAQNLIGQTAQLEFRLLETPENTKTVMAKIDEVLTPKKTEVETSKGKDTTQEKKIAKDLFSKEVIDTTVQEEEAGVTDKPFTSLLELSGSDFFLVALEDKPKIGQYLKDPKIWEQIPEDDTLAWATGAEPYKGVDYQKLYLIKKKAELSGKYLTDAREDFDQYRRPEVRFTMTKEGGRRFAQLTGANIDKPLGIVLDGRVESAPIIRAKIRESGVIEMGSGATIESARDLAVVLRAGALPAPVKIIENRVVGPSLGQDSINKGVKAAIIGIGAVLLLMGIYYRLSGIIADFAMILNLVYLLAALAGLHATLTLPGIAGIILTMGMSVDSNVLIFERIREELRTGKTIRASIDAGYKKALLTIIDSHVTTLITAAVLFQFGTGPIKGFAVTLSLGVIISLFTAVVVTRLVFNLRKNYQTLSI